MDDKTPKKTLHLSWKELWCLAHRISDPEMAEKARKHCALCVICEERLANLEAYIESRSGQEEKEDKDAFLEPWANAVRLLQEIETAPTDEEKSTILIFPAVFVKGESLGQKSRLCGADNSDAVLDRPMRLEITDGIISAQALSLLSKLRLMFSQSGDRLYLEFTEISAQELRRFIAKIRIGSQEYSGEEIDEQGGIDLGKIASSSPPGAKERSLCWEDLEKIEIAIRCQ